MKGYHGTNPMNKEWVVNYRVSEERKLELRLAPPGELFFAYNNTNHGTKRGFQHTGEAIRVEEDWSRDTSAGENIEKPGDAVNYTADADADADATTNKRIAYSPVVGWPPVRTSRKNLAGRSLSKSAASDQSPNEKEESGGTPENSKTQMFIKVNMEGIPIGRKVNLRAYNSYEELSLAIDDLFSGLLEAQRDSSFTEIEKKIEELAKADADECSLAGSGEYTLIYEDDEGDRVLVGDVPWHMFVSTAKRLHVLKTSEIPTLQFGNAEKEKTPLGTAVHI